MLLIKVCKLDTENLIIIKLLLDYKADIKLCNGKAFDEANKRNYKNIVALLKNK